MIRVAGVVLCGGESRRMGRPKAWLPFQAETLLRRMVRLVGEAASPVIVVAAANQDLPALPDGTRIVRDQRENAGPLEGLRAGFAALAGMDVAAVFVTGCDTPLLRPELIRFLTGELDGHQAAVPVDGAYFHPLAAVYRRDVLARIETLLAEGESRLSALCERLETRAIPVERLRVVDPRLESLTNVNRPEQYAELLDRFPPNQSPGL